MVIKGGARKAIARETHEDQLRWEGLEKFDSEHAHDRVSQRLGV